MKPLPTLGTPGKTIEVLRAHGLHAKKKYGQNFLVEPQVLADIVAAAGITGTDRVLEIGPGIGTLTQYLAYAAKEVTAVEIDRAMLPVLEETLAGYDNARVVQGDVLKVDLPEIMGGEPFKVVANLPYYVTTPILMELLERRLPITDITVMVQKEVADRMLASPGSGDYGALSLAVQYRCEPRIALTVPPSCFLPRPEVTSAVVHLELKGARVETSDEDYLFTVIRAAFGQRRKTLANALANAPGPGVNRQDVTEALSEMGLSGSIRGEALSLREFAELAERLRKA